MKITNDLIKDNLPLIEKFKTKEYFFYSLCIPFEVKYTNKIKNKYPFFILYKNALETTFYGGSIEIYQYSDDYFFVRLIYNSVRYNTYKIDQFYDLMKFLKLLFKDNNVNESILEKINKRKYEIDIYNKVRQSYPIIEHKFKRNLCNINELKNVTIFNEKELDKINKIMNLKISTRMNKFGFKYPYISLEIFPDKEITHFSHLLFIKILKDSDDYYFLTFHCSKEYENDYYKNCYRFDQLNELLTFLKQLFKENNAKDYANFVSDYVNESKFSY